MILQVGKKWEPLPSPERTAASDFHESDDLVVPVTGMCFDKEGKFSLKENKGTSPKTNMFPKKGPFQKERIVVFQALFFRESVSFRGSMSWAPNPSHWQWEVKFVSFRNHPDGHCWRGFTSQGNVNLGYILWGISYNDLVIRILVHLLWCCWWHFNPVVTKLSCIPGFRAGVLAVVSCVCVCVCVCVFFEAERWVSSYLNFLKSKIQMMQKKWRTYALVLNIREKNGGHAIVKINNKNGCIQK